MSVALNTPDVVSALDRLYPPKYATTPHTDSPPPTNTPQPHNLITRERFIKFLFRTPTGKTVGPHGDITDLLRFMVDHADLPSHTYICVDTVLKLYKK